MSETAFRGLSLIHFRVMDAMLDHRSTSLAANHLNITPSAISHSLARLREALDDPLFQRRGNRLEPTFRALEVGRKIKPLLMELAGALDPSEFDPVTSTREYRVLASPYALVTILPDLLGKLVLDAPNVSMKLMSAHDLSPLSGLLNGVIDIALGATQVLNPHIDHLEVIADELVWAMSVDHPIVQQGVNVETLSRSRHVIIEHIRPAWRGADDRDVLLVEAMAQNQDESNKLDLFMAQSGLRRNIAAVVPDTASALAMVSCFNLVALLPRRLGEMFGGSGIKLLQQEERRIDYRCHLFWHRDRVEDPAVRWLINEVKNLTSGASGQGEAEATH